RELAFLAGGDVSHPEIPIFDEGGLGSVGRHHGVARAAASTTATSTAAAAATTPSCCIAISPGRDARAGPTLCIAHPARLLRRIDKHKLGVACAGAIPHPAIGEPSDRDITTDDEIGERWPKHLRRAVVVRSGDSALRLLSVEWRERDEGRDGKQ